MEIYQEMVDKMRGKWECQGDCGVTKCSACGWNTEEYVGDYNFCPSCGQPKTDEAVDMMLDRMDIAYIADNITYWMPLPTPPDCHPPERKDGT